MTPAQRKHKNQIRKKIQIAKEKLGISHWDVELILSKDRDDGNSGAATCKSCHVYQRMTITLYKCAFEPQNDLDHIIKHEVSHCITDPIYKYCMDLLNARFRTHEDINEQREILTERIARLL